MNDGKPVESLIRLENLCKHFGTGATRITAVESVTFSVGPGEVLGFLGPNGAGKSTTMKMLTGYLPPTSGRAIVCGRDVQTDPMWVKERVGYLPEGAPAYPDMTPESFLKFCARVRGLTGRAGHEAVSRAVALTHLEGVLRQPIETLSKGFKRRVGLAQAVLHRPPVLVMDEPTDGLDPNQKHEVRRLIRDMAREGGRAIVLSTHILEEVEAVCTRVVVIARGRVVADSTPASLAARSRYRGAVTLSLSPPAGRSPLDVLSALDEAAQVEDLGTARTPAGELVTYTVLPRAGKDLLAAVERAARTNDWKVDQMRLEPGRLDDVFRDLTGGASR
ncbi:MAG: ABC transporter ATP-binding protein [Leptolyngbya sp. PLA1]|nr:ABC transporter ATP-binding protein [Leptolyngbya sp. PLA1]